LIWPRSRLARATLILLIVLGAPGTTPAQPASAAARSRSLQVGGLARSYLLHAPSSLAAGSPAPLVVVFHGGSGSPSGVDRLTRWSALADRQGFLVAYPEGVGFHWNDGRTTVASGAGPQADDVGFVAAMLDDIARERPLDPRRVYATGVSNGAIFAHYVGARLSARIAAIAAVAGGMADPFHVTFRPERPVSVLIIHGTKDPQIPYGGGDIQGGVLGRILPTEEALRLWAERNGATRPPSVEELPPSNDERCGGRRLFVNGRSATEVVLLRLEGGGHTWPGGPVGYLPERQFGRLCRDFDATAVIWDFFKGHPKP